MHRLLQFGLRVDPHLSPLVAARPERRRQSEDQRGEIGVRPRAGRSLAVPAPGLPDDVLVPVPRTGGRDDLAVEQDLLARSVEDRLDAEGTPVGDTLDAEALERRAAPTLEVGADADRHVSRTDLARHLAVDDAVAIVLRVRRIIGRRRRRHGHPLRKSLRERRAPVGDEEQHRQAVRRLLVLDRHDDLAVPRVSRVLPILRPLAADLRDPEVAVAGQPPKHVADLKAVRVEDLDEVEEHRRLAVPRRLAEPPTFRRVGRMGHRLLDRDMASAFEQAIDPLPPVRMGRDVEEIGVELVELLLPTDHRQAIGVPETRRPRPWVEAEDPRDAGVDGGVVDQLPDVAVDPGNGDRGGHRVGLTDRPRPRSGEGRNRCRPLGSRQMLNPGA